MLHSVQQSAVRFNVLLHHVILCLKIIFLSQMYGMMIVFLSCVKIPLHLQAVGVGSFSGTTAAASAAAIR
jgi:hypothetical protein